jgi:preprotein translocase subunit SecE
MEGLVPVGTFFHELLRVGIYKRSQGRVTRQVTFAVVAAAIATGLWRLSTILAGQGSHFQFGLPLVLLALGLWTAYRLVNMPAVADFLIAVEAEMNKVSWPSRTELFRASIVVLIMMFATGIYLAGCDVLWKIMLRLLGII